MYYKKSRNVNICFSNVMKFSIVNFTYFATSNFTKNNLRIRALKLCTFANYSVKK